MKIAIWGSSPDELGQSIRALKLKLFTDKNNCFYFGYVFSFVMLNEVKQLVNYEYYIKQIPLHEVSGRGMKKLSEC